MRRHEVLRTCFRVVHGSPTQIISPPRPTPLAVIDLTTETAEKIQERAELWSAREAARPFRIDQDLLLRATLLKLQAEAHVLLLTMHHLVADASSVDLIFRELLMLYYAFSMEMPSPLSEPHLQYADFAVWQRSYVSGEAIQRQLTYWRRQMTGAPPFLDLPIDWPRRAVQSYRGAVEAIAISSELTTRLKLLGQEEGASLFMTLLASFQVLLVPMFRGTGRGGGFGNLEPQLARARNCRRYVRQYSAVAH